VVRIKYNIDVMKYISLFESLTGAKVKDCIANDSILFVVHENDMGKAIGKNGVNVKKIGDILKRKIRLIEFNSDISQFIQNLIFPLKVKEIKLEENIVTIYGNDTKTKGLLIGRDRHKIKSINDIVKRYFDVTEIKVS